MGWLKPAESLLEPKQIWAAHDGPPPDGPVPEPAEGIVALGKTVKGVRIGGKGAKVVEDVTAIFRMAADCEDADILVEKEFDFVPVALLLGVPLLFRRLDHQLEEDGEECMYETKMYAYKLMITPGLGLPITWNQSGAGAPLPPLHACRSDGEPFTSDDWACLCEFHEYLDEIAVAPEQLWFTNKAEFSKWVHMWTRSACLSKQRHLPCAFADINPCLDLRFPLGLKVKAEGLAGRPELNGKTGVVKKYDLKGIRVGIEFPPPHGLLAIKHTNIVHTDGGAGRADMLMKEVDNDDDLKKKGRRELPLNRAPTFN